MAMGKPLICNSGVGDTDEIVQRYAAGLVLEELSETAFQNIQLPAIDIIRLREGAEEYFSLDKGVERYAAVYHRILE